MVTKVSASSENLGLQLMRTEVTILFMKTSTVVSFFGGGRGAKSRIARALGVSTAAVAKWREFVPDGSAYQLIQRFPALYDLDKADCVDASNASQTQ
ncbi:Cro/CI family transcriptional regulator [Chromobacterium haemolyticum]|uniref:Cro/CI family transcriptional regulator n=1 Tax=Chromobacterium haemolyticum TaxID=394935 RepID=UPI0009DB0197|nr:hypothetical protein B0T39_11110 [Chromobacterium haemolyticum]PTU70784.1 hypothetical protein DBB33_15665 [Chromobacterium haemolyticum]